MAKKCTHKKLILGSMFISEMTPDEEPYKSGEEVELDSIPINEFVFGHYCPKCERIIGVWCK